MLFPSSKSLFRTGFLALALVSSTALAQEAQRVAAVVNDDIISIHDLDQRMKLALMSTNLPDSVEARSRILPQVIRRLIDERLELQEAEKQKVSVDTSELIGAMIGMERQNNMPRGALEQLLRQQGVDPETLRQQLRADIAWGQVVHQELTRDVHVGDEAVNTRIANLKANLGKPEYQVGEIYLAVEGVRSEEQVRTLAERLIEQLRQGAPFQALALQFSQSGGGGMLGWVSEGMLDDQLMQALSRLQPRGVTQPIRTGDGYHILTLIDKRRIGEGLSSGPSIDALTVELSSLPSATLAERDAQLKRLQETVASAKTCDQIEEKLKGVPSTSYYRNERVPEAALQGEMAKKLETVPDGQLGGAIEAGNVRRMMAVCGRQADQPGGLPSYDDMKRRMENEQLENLARRYLRDLRRNAYVDVRI